MQLQLLTDSEIDIRLNRLRTLMEAAGIDAILVSNHANQYYLTGRVFEGYVLLDAHSIHYYIRRPLMLDGENVTYIRKPEDIIAHMSALPATLGLEADLLSYNQIVRLQRVFDSVNTVNADALLRAARAVKTPGEQAMLRQSGVMHSRVYAQIPGVYRPGMTDIEFQIEVERLSRLGGCPGIFRISGSSMELFMGNVICGDNADTPSPYDFAMGGAGQDPSLPVGANGTPIRPGMMLMVDMNGNYTGYMTDMTRVYSVGDVDPLAARAHRCSIRIHRELCEMAHPGAEAKALYERAIDIVNEEDLSAYFMGYSQQAGFVGHGVGIEINELPVIAPRSRDILAAGNVIALEPKFVIPHVGAVGIENTYIITDGAPECVTVFNEEIINLD